MSVVCRNVFWLNSKGALLHRVVSAMLADYMSYFFARVGALCVPRGTSHRVEFV